MRDRRLTGYAATMWIAPEGQTRVQAPQPEQREASTLTRSVTVIASRGQEDAHTPHPLQTA